MTSGLMYFPTGLGHWKQQVFTANGTWTRPTNVTSVHLLMVAGGQAGFQNQFSLSNCEGGSGGEVLVRILNDLDESSYTIVIGAGGTGGGGALGTNTTFSNSTTTLLTARAATSTQCFPGGGHGGRGLQRPGEGSFGFGGGGAGGTNASNGAAPSNGGGKTYGNDAKPNSGGGGGGYYHASNLGGDGGSGICIVTWSEY